MSRPFKCRAINWKPRVYYFKPQGINLSSLEVIVINEDELEALRLKDYEKKHGLKAVKEKLREEFGL